MFLIICSVLFTGMGANPGVQTTTGHAAIGSQAPAAAPTAQSQIAVAERLYRTGEMDSAAEQYKRILQTDPKSAAAYVGLARVYLKQKKPAEASGAASKAMELAPGLDAAHVAMDEVYFRQGKLADAEKEFAPLVNAETIEARAYLGLARLYRSASFYKQWKRMTDRAYALDPSDPDVRRAWVETLDGQERIKALRAYLAGPTKRRCRGSPES